MYVEPIARVKSIIEGECRGNILVLDKYISFFGEIDPETGCLRGESTCISNKVLVFRGSRGSTVGPYVVYALKKNSKAPTCIIVSEIEPMLVVGCVIAEIPLYITDSFDKLLRLPWNTSVEVRGDWLYAERI